MSFDLQIEGYVDWEDNINISRDIVETELKELEERLLKHENRFKPFSEEVKTKLQVLFFYEVIKA